MAKKKKIKETTIEDFYDLRVDKVDELVAALKGEDTSAYGDITMNISEIVGDGKASNKEFNPYSTDFLSRIPAFLKALFIKWWFAGVVCFFVNMGLGVYIAADDVLLLDGIVLGIIVDVLVNPLFHFMETDRREYNSFMLFPFPFRQFWTFFTNIIYYALVLFIVGYCYTGVNELVNYIRGTVQYTYLPVEPVMFGAFSLMVDMIFIGLKDLLVYLLKKRKNKRREAVADV